MSKLEAVAIVHFDEHGNQGYHVCGDERFRLFIVDDRAPHDRVYEITDRCTGGDIKALMRDDPIGSKNDGRHEAIKARILEGIEGKPRLTVVDD